MQYDANAAIDAKMKEVKDALIERGFVVQSDAGSGISLCHPEFRKETYLGTFLNPFSCLDYDEEPEKVYLWQDAKGIEAANVYMEPIYRSNATSKNVNVRIVVSHRHWTLGDYAQMPSEHFLANQIFVRELKNSPTNLFEPIRATANSVDCVKVYERKLNVSASDRVTAKVVDEIEAAVKSFQIRDHRDVERDPHDFHEDTTTRHFAWRNAWKARHAE